MPCRIKYQGVWVARILLEQALHSESCFATLTFDDDHIPYRDELDLVPAQDFVRSLRKRSRRKVRYVIVGEYGETNPITKKKDGGIYRPHFHAALFGIQSPELIQAAWKNGFTDVRGLGVESARYICSYMLKRQNTRDRCNGKEPEFKIQSMKPGIGADAIKLLRLPPGEVPTALRLSRSLYPLGRYLINTLRARQGDTEEQKAFRHRLAQFALQQRDPITHQEKLENAKRQTRSSTERRREKPGL